MFNIAITGNKEVVSKVEEHFLSRVSSIAIVNLTLSKKIDDDLEMQEDD